MNQKLDDLLQIFTTVSKKPQDFLSVQEKSAETIKDLTKELYDYTKANEKHTIKNTLPRLIVHNFDEEQIWQELELQNEYSSNKFIESAPQLCVKKDKLKFPIKLKVLKNAIKETIKTNELVNEHENEDNLDEETGEDGGSEDEDSKDDLSETENVLIPSKRKLKPSIVDDKFFKLSELEFFLQNEEKNEDTSKKENLDLFENFNDGGADYKYSDFFENPDEDTQNFHDKIVDKNEDEEEFDEGLDGESIASDEDEAKLDDENGEDMDINDEDGFKENEESGKKDEVKKKNVRFNLLGSDEESTSGVDSEEEPKDLFGAKKKLENKGIKSSLEERQERLSRVIEKLEEEALSEKPWQLKGEITANSRPQNSLLEETVDFDLSVRPAPVITGEVTMRLEDVIMQRIKDKAWDDVERKVKPVETPSEFKKKLALDQEKSKLSLAEVYEQEFIRQREAATADDTERQEKEPALHVEVRSMLHSLFNKLDAFSNYHYTPRPVAPEMKIVSNVAAINMEEVAPVTVAESTLLAPQEIKGKKRRGEPMSKEERTDTDKKRARRLKKTKQRQRKRDKERAAKEVAKINPGLGNKYSKLKAEKQVLEASSNITKMDESKEKVIKSSTSFFNKLQDEVKSQIKGKTPAFSKKKIKHNVTAKKLKL